ncbi:MAG TPA: MFS transporter [Alphaproteobacteria bacterium]|nr:MFS transporter [Alphaproteobacteria bacterium]
MTADRDQDVSARTLSPLARLPLYYGWVVVAIAFVTMGIGVSVRTSFSLLFPPILAEFKWDRGVTAGIYSVGFLCSMLLSPFIGALIARFGPAPLLSAGAVIVSGSLMLTTAATTQFHLFLTLGTGVVGGSVILAYVSHSYFLPFWFTRRRGLAIGIAFSGVGAGAMVLFPWLQSIIGAEGWREACWTMAILLLAIVLPLNLFFQRGRPEDMGLKPDGDGRAGRKASGPAVDNVVDRAWVDTDWSLVRAIRTTRFWWLSLGYFAGMYAWYSILIHQTKYLGEIGFSTEIAALALGLVGLMGVAGQISLGALSDRIGREFAWVVGCVGFAACYALLLVMKAAPSQAMLYLMVTAQGLIGYGVSAIYPTIMAELFHSRRYGQIYGAFSAISGFGAAVGPWATGALFDLTGDYQLSWTVALGACGISALGVWMAAPRKVRLVSGQAAKRAAETA